MACKLHFDPDHAGYPNPCMLVILTSLFKCFLYAPHMHQPLLALNPSSINSTSLYLAPAFRKTLF